MPFKPEDVRKAVIALTLGGIAGAAIVQSHHDEAKKSRAEKEDPEDTEWICDIVWDLLDDWEPPDMEREDNYMDHLFRCLRDEPSATSWKRAIRMSPLRSVRGHCAVFPTSSSGA